MLWDATAAGVKHVLCYRSFSTGVCARGKQKFDWDCLAVAAKVSEVFASLLP